MKNVKIFGCVAFLCAMVSVNVALLGDNKDTSIINLDTLFSITSANAEGTSDGEVDCFSTDAWNPMYSFVDCGTCCEENGRGSGTERKCKRNPGNCD